MIINRRRFFLLLIIFCNAFTAYSQPVTIPKIDFSPRSYVCYKTQAAIQVDGKLNEPGWLHAKWTEEFTDIEGPSKPAPRFKTRVKMLWDDHYLYIAAGLEETDIWANLRKRDTIIFYDNDFEVFIDPDGDTRDYYEIEMNALNTVWDLFLTGPYRDGDEGKAIIAWDITGLKSAVNVQGTLNKPGDADQSWTVEMAIPLDVLKEGTNGAEKLKSGDTWRMNFSRVEWQTENKNGKYQKKVDSDTEKHYPENNWVWSPTGLINIHYPELWGFVQFSGKIIGTVEEKFVMNPDELVKWELRKIYYSEKIFHAKNKRFTTSFEDLGLKPLQMKGYREAEIQCTDSQFEAIMTKEDKSYTWHIIQTGKTWKSAMSREQ